MAYLGRGVDKISNVETLDNITFNGASSYTLQKGGVNFVPISAAAILISIDGIVQSGNFTVSTSTIDFGTAIAGTSTCNFIIHLGVGLVTTVADGAITAAKLGANSVTSAKLNNDIISGTTELASEPADTDEFLVSDAGTLKRIDYSLIKGGGITMADQWRITASSSDSSGQDITTNWSRSGHTAYGQLGTGMTESSGIFTFPSTGIYSVIVQAVTQAKNGDMNQGEVYLKATTNNSSYDIVSQAENQCLNNKVASVSFQALIDVTDTSNVKIKIFTYGSGASYKLRGNSDKAETCAIFIRLGDT